MRGVGFVWMLLILAVVPGYSQLFNFPPTAVADEATTLEDQPVSFNVIANDRDPNGNLDPTTVDLNVEVIGVQDSVVVISKGTFTVDSTGLVTFTPLTSFYGSVRVKYNVSDSMGATSNDANIDVEVQAVNVPPVAVNDAATTNEDAPATVNALLNDSDSDGTLDTSKVDLDVEAAGIQKSEKKPEGDWSVNKGVVTFKPKSKFSGTATIEYVVYDNENAPSNRATITITVVALNKPPVAVNDAGATTVNKPVTINVVSNDSDPDGTVDPTKLDLNPAATGIQGTASTAQGTFTASTVGEVTYTPIANFTGTATLGYTISDNQGAVSNTATITINVQAVNRPPVAVNDNATTNKNKPVTIRVTDNDTDSDGTIDPSKVDLNPTLAGLQNTFASEQGTFSVNTSGVVTYTPANNFTGAAALAYTVNDNSGATSNEALVNIVVQNVNSPPVAANDNAATSQNTAVTVNVVANDTDSDGVVDAARVDLNTSTAGIQSTNTTAQGSFVVNNIGIVTYTPVNNFTGNATLAYVVSDNSGALSNAATITIAVQPVNAPIANEDKATTRMNVPVTIDIVANDRDSDGAVDPATVDLNTTLAGVQKSNTTAQGDFAVNAQGLVTFSPKKDVLGSATIRYTVSDNKGVASNAANIVVTIEAIPNNAPVIAAFEAESDTLRYVPGSTLEITEDFDVSDDGDSLVQAEIGFTNQYYTPGSDRLLFEDTPRILGQFNVQTGLLTLSGRATMREYRDAVRSVRYSYTAENYLRPVVKKIYVRVSDGNKFSTPKERMIRVGSGVKDLDIPTAFTPNGDGANDAWRILLPPDVNGSEFADAEVKVYDKKGSVVYDANGLSGEWDGSFQGKLLPVDTYYYTIDLKRTQKRYKGMVAILR